MQKIRYFACFLPSKVIQFICQINISLLKASRITFRLFFLPSDERRQNEKQEYGDRH